MAKKKPVPFAGEETPEEEAAEHKILSKRGGKRKTRKSKRKMR